MMDENSYQAYLRALLAGDREACARLVNAQLDAGADLKTLYVQLLQRAQYEVGELWEQQKITVATEHLATAVTQRMMTLIQARVLRGPPRQRSIVVACVADELHQLGGRMIADFCELRGWRGHFLGANATLEELLRVIDQTHPDLVGLSLSLPFNLPRLLAALDALSAAHPGLPIVVGGQAFRWGAQSALAPYPNVRYIATLDELEQRMADCE